VVLVEAGKALRAGIDYNPHLRLPEGSTTLFPWLARGGPHLILKGITSLPLEIVQPWSVKALGVGRAAGPVTASLRATRLQAMAYRIRRGSPYYSKRTLHGVYGHKDGCPTFRMENSCDPQNAVSRDAAETWGRSLKAKGRKMEFVAQRKAILTEDPSSTRPRCHYCGECMSGCCVDAKYTSANTPIPLALKTRNLTLRTESTMTRILLDESHRKLQGSSTTMPGQC
jgi:choline dehydrogenase-like flavoprotein